MKRILEKKFNTIGNLDCDALIKELQNYNTVSDKLDYLKSIKEQYYDKFQSVIGDFSKDEKIYFYTDNNRTQFWESVFGNFSLITPLSIPEPVFERYFKNGLNNPEFTYWFLKYNSSQAFDLHINSEEFRSKVNSDLKTTFIEAELKQLNDFEAKAKTLLLNKELDIYRPHPNNFNYYKEVVLLRVLDGKYYKENTLNAISNFGDEVQAYYKYKLLKPYLVSKQNELPNKINALFQFISYLHSNIENFNQYNGLIKELELLKKERNKLKPEQNYKDRLQSVKVQTELESKFQTLQKNTANLIKAKAKELNVCDFNNEANYSFNGVENEIHQLKENFSHKDLPEIFKHKRLYLDYRSNTHKTFLSLQLFFNELDEITKSLFDYFKDTEQNEFEAFETKAIPVNSIEEAIKGFQEGQSKFIISPTSQKGLKDRITKTLSNFNFFQITTVSEFEFEGNIHTNIRQRNNDSILTVENWEQQKETFFSQRMATYKDGYTHQEKIKLELELLEKLPKDSTGYEVLKDRYTDYLKTLPPQLIDLNQNRTKKVISETFENMDKKAWKYAFTSEQDYNLFTDLLTNFFEYKDYSLPGKVIQLKRTCKTKVAKALGEIHKELSNENKLSTDADFFEIIRVLNHFEKESKGDLYKALTR